MRVFNLCVALSLVMGGAFLALTSAYVLALGNQSIYTDTQFNTVFVLLGITGAWTMCAGILCACILIREG